MTFLLKGLEEATTELNELTKYYACLECVKMKDGIIEFPVFDRENGVCSVCSNITNVYKFLERKEEDIEDGYIDLIEKED